MAKALSHVHQNDIVHAAIQLSVFKVDPATCRVTLTDFSRSHELTKASPLSDEILDEALPYLAPEKSGRVAFTPDHRSDLYSLGICYYEMIVGSKPFFSDTKLGWFQKHISETAIPIADMRRDIPKPLANVIAKLMAKNQEDRYQSAEALCHDLEEMLYLYLENPDLLDQFIIASTDIKYQIIEPNQLVGRDDEIETLKEIVETSLTKKQIHFVRVFGSTGIGKTALIKYLSEVLRSEPGIFLESNGHQDSIFQSFASMKQILNQIYHFLLRISEQSLESLKNELRQELGDDLGGLNFLVPDLCILCNLISPPVEPSGEAQKHIISFQMSKIIYIVARRLERLILFFDDFQWTDESSLHVIDRIARAKKAPITMIVTLQDEKQAVEIDRSLKSVQQLDPLVIKNLKLNPLTLDSVEDYLNQSFIGGLQDKAFFAKLLLDKTGGNPFFLKSAIIFLESEKAFYIDHSLKKWSFKQESLKSLGTSESVVEVILAGLPHLTDQTKTVLKTASVFLGSFEPTGVQHLNQSIGLKDVESILLKAETKGILTIDKDESKQQFIARFQHDRIRDAFYSLLSEQEKASLHLNICDYLFTDRSFETTVVERARHYNLSSQTVTSEHHRTLALQANYAAGVRMLSETLYDQAEEFFSAAKKYLSEHCWQEDYRRTFDTHILLAESHFRSDHIEQATKLTKSLRQHAKSSIDRTKLCLLELEQYIRLGKLDAAYQAGIDGLKFMGISIKRSTNPIIVLFRYLKVKKRLSENSFINQKSVSFQDDSTLVLKQKLLNFLGVAAYQLDLKNLMAYCSLLSVEISCINGFSPISSRGLANVSILLMHIFNNQFLAHKVGELIENIQSHNTNLDDKPYVLFVLNAFVHIYTKPLPQLKKSFMDAERLAHQIGDETQEIYNRNCWVFLSGLLFSVEEDLEYFGDHHPGPDISDHYWVSLLYRLPMNALLGEGKGEHRFGCRLASDEELFEGTRNNPFAKTMYHAFRCCIHVLFDEREKALEQAKLSEGLLNHPLGISEYMLLPYQFLALSLSFDKKEGRRYRRHRMHAIYNKFRRFERTNPQNVEPLIKLMKAEILKTDGNTEDAIKHYEIAVQAADKSGIASFRSLFRDMAARFYQSSSLNTLAYFFYREALECYRAWGAKSKVRQIQSNLTVFNSNMPIDSQSLDKNTIKKLSDPSNAGIDGALAQENLKLDFEQIIKSSESLAQEMDLSRLLTKLLDITRSITSAQKAHLILNIDGDWQTYSSTKDFSGISVEKLDESNSIPKSIIYFTIRSAQSVMLDKAYESSGYQDDPYVREHGIKSILTVPMIQKRQVIGLVYLEHRLVKGAFTADRYEVLQVILSQASIFISNANLYSKLEDKVQLRTRELYNKNKEIEVILDNIKQGIFVIKKDGMIREGYSHYLNEIFRSDDIISKSALELLFEHSSISRDRYDQIETTIKSCLSDASELDFQANLHLLPNELVKNSPDGQALTYLDIEWQALINKEDMIDSIMVVVRDKTEFLKLQSQATEKEQEIQIIEMILSSNPQRIREFLVQNRSKLEAMLVTINDDTISDHIKRQIILRNLHTVKGNSRTVGFQKLSDIVHRSEQTLLDMHPEDKLSINELIRGELKQIFNELEKVERSLLKILNLNNNDTSSFFDTRSKLESLYKDLDDNDVIKVGYLKGYLRNVYTDQCQYNFERMEDDFRLEIRKVSQELEKCEALLNMSYPDLQLTPAMFFSLSEQLMHCIRNSLDHGIETSSERLNQDKPEKGTISVVFTRNDTEQSLDITISDDGRGLHIARLAHRSNETKLLDHTANRIKIARSIFEDGISTKDQLSQISGRGVGMSSVRDWFLSQGGAFDIVLKDEKSIGFYDFQFQAKIPISKLVDKQPKLKTA